MNCLKTRAGAHISGLNVNRVQHGYRDYTNGCNMKICQASQAVLRLSGIYLHGKKKRLVSIIRILYAALLWLKILFLLHVLLNNE